MAGNWSVASKQNPSMIQTVEISLNRIPKPQEHGKQIHNFICIVLPSALNSYKFVYEKSLTVETVQLVTVMIIVMFSVMFLWTICFAGHSSA